MARRIIVGMCIVASVAAFGSAQAQPRDFACRAGAALTWVYDPDMGGFPEDSYVWTITGQGSCKAVNGENYSVSFSGTSYPRPAGTGLCKPSRAIGFGPAAFEVNLTLTRILDGTKTFDSQTWHFGDGFNPPLGTNPGATLFTVGRLTPLQNEKRGAGVLTSQGCNSSGTPAQVIWAFTRA